MQQLGTSTLVVDGVTVYSDHADPNHFWYLPAPVRISRRRDDGRAALTFIRYRPAAVEGGARGGGFLMFETDLRLEPDQERRIRSAVSRLASGEVTLSPVPFDSGTVECVALDLQGAGGTAVAEPPPEGAIQAVERILGATVPSLAGDNSAMFSLVLSQEGAIILDQALEQGTTPVGVLYRLEYSILHPALHVRIEADLDRIYTHFSASLEGQYAFLKLGIDAGFERLRQEGVIRIEVIDFSGADDRAEKESWALEFFKENILADWFRPSLGTFKGVWEDGNGSDPSNPVAALGEAARAAAGATPGGNRPGGSESGTPPGTATPEASGTPGGTRGASTGSPTATTAGSTTTAPAGSATATPAREEGAGAGATATEAPRPTSDPAPDSPMPRTPERRPATWNVTRTEPDPTPADRRVEFTASTEGDRERLVFHGGSAPPVVEVDGTPVALEGRTLTLEVPAGQGRSVVARWTAVEPRMFKAFFEFDRPRGSGHRNFELSAATRDQYLASPSGDTRFDGSSDPSGCAQGSGAQALRHWFRNCLRSDMVDIEAHASWEDRPEANEHNLRLSHRRQQIAEAYAREAGVSIRVAAHQGAARARNAGRVSSPDLPSDDRVVEISEHGPREPEVRIEGRIAREGGTEPPPPPPPPGEVPPAPPRPPGGGETPRPTPTPTPTPAPTPTPPGAGATPQLTFRLRFVHQDERKRFKMVYNRTGAVKRTYAPQGFIGLLAADLEDSEKHFVEVDLDDPFFRELNLEVDAPFDFERLGLASAHVDIRYGSDEDRGGVIHRDFVFRPEDRGPRREGFFLRGPGALSYRRGIRYHFSPDSDWLGESPSFDAGFEESEERTFAVNPAEHLDFHEVRLAPGDVDWGIVRSLDVDLTYASESGWTTTRTFTFTSDDPGEQRWRIRTPRGEPFAYTSVVRAHLTDGTTRESEPRTHTGSTLPVNDPFTGALEIDFVPAWAPGEVRFAFVDVEYDDPDNGYRRTARIELDGFEPERGHLRIALLDPDHREFTYRVSFLGPDHRMIRTAPVVTDDTLVAVSPPSGPAPEPGPEPGS